MFRSSKKKAKKPDQPTVPEGDEESSAEDDETDKSSTVSSITGNGDDIERAIEEKIRSVEDGADEDEELAQAKKRLAYMTALPSMDDSIATGGDAHQKSSGEDDDRDWKTIPSEPNETTSLLTNDHQADDDEEASSSDSEHMVPPTKNEEVLKPSIFTTLGGALGRGKDK